MERKISSPNDAVMHWPLGRITEVFPDNVGIVQTVIVKTKDSLFKNAVQNLVLLPVNE